MSRKSKPKPKTCAYKHWSFDDGHCPRPVWREGDDYCLFHSENKEKAEEFNAEIEKIKEGDPSELYKMGVKEGYENCDFLGFRFPTGISFRAHEFKAETDFSKAAFSGHADFREAAFSGDADFSEAAFSGDASFWKAAFSGNAYFREAAFSGDADFREAAFSGDADFREAAFSGYAYFFKAAFSGDAYFFKAAFSGDADFREAAFSGYADFFKAAFSGKAYFREAAFSGYAYFREAAFSGYAYFFKAAFSGDAYFFKAAFLGITFFSAVEFKEEAFFNSVTFRKAATFAAADFSKNAFFDGSTFFNFYAKGLRYKGILSLVDVTFTGDDPENPTSFGSVFLERANIAGPDLSFASFHTTFIREVNFVRVTFGEKLRNFWWRVSSLIWGRTKYTLNEERVARSGSIVKAQTKYLLAKHREKNVLDRIRDWLKGLFKKQQEEEPAENKDSGQEKDSGEEQESPLVERKKRFGTAETVYAMLKHTMEERHAGKLARRMRACELEARLHGSAGWIERIFLFLYRFLNGFGLRWFRALVFWMICMASFAIYAYEGQEASYEAVQPAKEGSELARELKKELLDRPDAFLHSLEISTILPRPSRHIEYSNIRWAETAQRVLSPFLLFLFIQAVRNTIRD